MRKVLDERALGGFPRFGFELDTGDKPHVADVDHVRHFAQAVHRLLEVGGEFLRALEQPFFLEHVEARFGRGGGERVSRVGGKGSSSNISLTIKRGEILGMFGLVGSGRTQVARSIFGADRFTSGEILLNGKSIHPKSPREAVNSGIALLTEDRKRDGLVMNCTIRDNVSLASYWRLIKFDIINRRKQATEVKTLVQDLDVRPPSLDRLVSHLSGGNQQKVVLAKWLLTHAKVMILDEPTRGVDVATKVEIYHIIDKLARAGMCILFISSELPEILGMSDRTLVMREGRLVGEFSRAEASEEKVLSSAAGVRS